RIVFWKLGHWLARKYRATLKTLCRLWFALRRPDVPRRGSLVVVIVGDTLRHHIAALGDQPQGSVQVAAAGRQSVYPAKREAKYLRIALRRSCFCCEQHLRRRAGCAGTCKSGSGRRGRKIVRLRPVSHSTV